MKKVISVKLPHPSNGIVTGRTMQAVLTSLVQKITTDFLDQRVTHFWIERENQEIQIHFEDEVNEQ